jgi:hypothetical protein
LTDPLVTAAALGALLGVQHAMDGDHVVAVATIVTRERRFAAGVLIGALWGVGHTITLAVAAAAVLGLGLGEWLPEAGLELVVALMLVALGAARLRGAVRGLHGAPTEHLRAEHLADHGHGALETVHRHPHAHGGAVHEHAHVHPSARLLGALAGRRGRLAWRPLLVGAVHGMAGSASVSLLVLGTIHSPVAAALYVGLFGLGTIAGMTALTAAMAYPLSLAPRFERARHGVGAVAGLASIAFGLFLGARLV